MEAVHTSLTGLDALFLEDARLDAGGPAADATGGKVSGPATSGAAGYAAVDVIQRKLDNRLERLALTSRLEAQLAAVKARDVAEIMELQQAMTPPGASLADRSFDEVSVVEEIAGVLTVSSASAGALVMQSRKICSLPPAMNALACGAISWMHARIIADETEGLDRSGAEALVAHFFNPDSPKPARAAAPGELIPARFRRKVRVWRERHHPETLEKRHAKGRADRRMEYAPDRDGMAWVSLYLPGDTACAIWNKATDFARGLQGPTEPRTLAQLRSDIASGLLLGGGTGQAANGDSRGHIDGEVPTPRTEVLVTVPVFALLGLTDEPALLDGYGPIPASMARKLTSDGAGSFYRVLVDPRDGAPLEIGRTSYRLTKAMRKVLQLRDGKCTFPGCSNHSLDTETDHLTAWHHGGTTGISNLGQLCRKHHHLKHASGWTPGRAQQNEPPGWTSPTGRYYPAERHDWESPQWPPIPEATREYDAPAHTQKAGLHPSVRLSPETSPSRLLDPDVFAPDDPVWEDFYAMPIRLPQDPLAKWEPDPVPI
ncbi:DUF222 domain-containing protein [Pseudarthrobacter sp. NamE5]|nr:DUF222 domain-containing protein [Pseudarthrobacter sp. NamE5]